MLAIFLLFLVVVSLFAGTDPQGGQGAPDTGRSYLSNLWTADNRRRCLASLEMRLAQQNSYPSGGIG
jgi:hypothetical protein